MMKSWMLEIVNQLLEERDTLLDFKDNCELERKYDLSNRSLTIKVGDLELTIKGNEAEFYDRLMEGALSAVDYQIGRIDAALRKLGIEVEERPKELPPDIAEIESALLT